MLRFALSLISEALCLSKCSKLIGLTILLRDFGVLSYLHEPVLDESRSECNMPYAIALKTFVGAC